MQRRPHITAVVIPKGKGKFMSHIDNTMVVHWNVFKLFVPLQSIDRWMVVQMCFITAALLQGVLISTLGKQNAGEHKIQPQPTEEDTGANSTRRALITDKSLTHFSRILFPLCYPVFNFVYWTQLIGVQAKQKWFVYSWQGGGLTPALTLTLPRHDSEEFGCIFLQFCPKRDFFVCVLWSTNCIKFCEQWSKHTKNLSVHWAFSGLQFNVLSVVKQNSFIRAHFGWFWQQWSVLVGYFTTKCFGDKIHLVTTNGNLLCFVGLFVCRNNRDQHPCVCECVVCKQLRCYWQKMAGPHPSHPLPPLKCDFWAAWAILSKFCFHKQYIYFFKKFFHPNFFSPPKIFSHFHFLCISGCFMPSWVVKKN